MNDTPAAQGAANGPAPGGVLVLTALDLEYEAVRAHLSGLREQAHPAGTLFETGHLNGGGQVTIAVTGEGNQGAAVLAERGIAMFRPQAVMFVGVAGALKDDISLGDVVVGTKIYAYHGGAEGSEGFLARPRAYPVAHELEQLARRIARTGDWAVRLGPSSAASRPGVHFKPIAAGEVVLNSRDTPLARQLRHTYQDAAAIEMESAGLSQASHYNRGLPAITIRGISDRADGHKHAADQEGWQPRAAAGAAAFAAALAQEIMTRNPANPGEPPRKEAGATQYVTAHQGGIAYGVLHGTMHLAEQAPGQAGPSAASTAASPRAPGAGWDPLPGPIRVTWRSDLVRGSGYQRATLELHLAAVSRVDRIEVRRLAPLAGELALLGRSKMLFTPAEQLDAGSSAQAAWAAAAGPRTSMAGLAVGREGQRSAWQALPGDSLGALLDQDDLTRQISYLLGLLTAIDAPVPEHVAPAIGIEPAMLLSEGRVAGLPRSRASLGYRAVPFLRVAADEAVPSAHLTSRSLDVAQELAARLLAAFRETR